ncbi:MAG: DUF2267 domain-containing protein [Clostridia bacterium]|nr:DUF2267 domain-containing protein [Clostridia bacterium]
MQYEEFIGQVQYRARLHSQLAAERAARATLQTLAERLAGGAAGNLAAQLPQPIARWLDVPPAGDGFSLDEFFRMVSEREEVELPEAVHHARAVMDVLQDAVTPGVIENIRAQLPDEYDPLFESGSNGPLAR